MKRSIELNDKEIAKLNNDVKNAQKGWDQCAVKLTELSNARKFAMDVETIAVQTDTSVTVERPKEEFDEAV